MQNRATHRRQNAGKNRPASAAPAVFSLMEPLEPRQLMSATYTVTNTLDNSHHGSLRWAINQVNKDAGKKGPDAIAFDIPGSGTQTIAPLSQLPMIKYSVTLDGTTQPGYSGSPLIDINGDAMTGGGGGDAGCQRQREYRQRPGDRSFQPGDRHHRNLRSHRFERAWHGSALVQRSG